MNHKTEILISQVKDFEVYLVINSEASNTLDVCEKSNGKVKWLEWAPDLDMEDFGCDSFAKAAEAETAIATIYQAICVQNFVFRQTLLDVFDDDLKKQTSLIEQFQTAYIKSLNNA